MSDVPAADELRAEGDRKRRGVRNVAAASDRARLTVTGIAVALRLIGAITLSTAPVGLHDPLLYQRFAQGIAKGDGYVSFNGELTSYYPPGYPFFLGALQWVCDRLSISAQLPLVAGLVQAFLGGLAVWAVIGVGDRLAPESRERSWRGRFGVVAGLILALWPNLILHSTVLLSETLFLAVFCCFLLAMVRALQSGAVRALLGAGLLLGLAALVRPQVVLVLAAVAVAALLLQRTWLQRFTLVGLPLVGLILAVTPWTIRNATVFHELVAISTNGGDNLCVGFHPGATGHFEIPPSCDTGEFYIDGPAAEARRNDETSTLATDWATDNVSALPMLSLRKLWYTYQHDHDALRAVESYEEDRFLPDPVRSAVRWGSDGYYVLGLVAMLAGGLMIAQRWWRDRRGQALIAFLIVATAASALVPILFFGETRFKVPSTPLFALLAAPAVMLLLQRERPDAPAPDQPAVTSSPETAA